MDRFLRLRHLVGEEAFARLQNSRVTVAGIGAVGGHAMEGLARAGVGHLRLVDFDVIRRHNINRQIIALESTVGQRKVFAARDRILAINPSCRVEVMPCFIDSASLTAILEPLPDLLVDAIDTVGPKIELLAAAHGRGIPLLSSMGAALRTDPSQVRVADLMQTEKCPLARRLRKKLRQRGIERGITCVYSTEESEFVPGPELPEEEVDPSLPPQSRPPKFLGSLPTLTGIFGLIIANQAILHLTGRKPLP